MRPFESHEANRFQAERGEHGQVDVSWISAMKSKQADRRTSSGVTITTYEH